MVDIASISAAIQGIKSATEIAQAIRNADVSLQAAEHKLQLADLVSALADTKIALSAVQEQLQEKDLEIQRLNESLRLKKQLKRDGDSYYEVTDSGELIGDPYCSHCFEVKGLAVHISQNPSNRRESTCPACKAVFNWRPRKQISDRDT